MNQAEDDVVAGVVVDLVGGIDGLADEFLDDGVGAAELVLGVGVIDDHDVNHRRSGKEGASFE